MQRRSFLKFLGLGVAAPAVAVVAPEPVRRYWFFGEQFFKPTANTLFQGQVAAEWRDDPKYSSVQLPTDHGFTYNAGSGLYLALPGQPGLFKQMLGRTERDGKVINIRDF